MQLDGAVVVVTGAGSGIGAALCERFAVEASAVVALDLDADAAGRTAQRIEAGTRSAGLEVWSAGCDVADPDEVTRVVGPVLERHGRVDLSAPTPASGPAPASKRPMGSGSGSGTST